MNIWHISDSHGFHNQYLIPKDIDCVIFSGDYSNHFDVFKNELETINFLDWFKDVPIKNKIMISGNHDSFAFNRKRLFKELITLTDIIYLEDKEVIIDGIKFYGTPYTPRFGDWFFMRKREKMQDVWGAVPKDVNVLIAHGPPKGILDLTVNRDSSLSQCGDNSIHKFISKWEKLKLMCFGHIHNGKSCINQGVFIKDNIFYSNAAGVEDGKFEKGLINNGNIITI